MYATRVSIWLAIGSILSAGLACSDSKTKSVNPNGDSELALLMRQMHDDGMLTKQQLLEGKDPEINVPYHKMQTAKATEPEKVADPRYAAFASLYEAKVKSLLEATEDNQVEAYTSMVDACMSCHEQVCPGPMRKIKRMYLSDKELASLEPDSK